MPIDKQITDGTPPAALEAPDPADVEEAALNQDMADLGIT
jgi:hypothetical protein